MSGKVAQQRIIGASDASIDTRKTDTLCELTARLHTRTLDYDYDLPEPDYDEDLSISSDRENIKNSNIGRRLRPDYYRNMEADYDNDDPVLSPEDIRRMMPKEHKELQRDLKSMQKRGDYPKRPEFKTKHHEIMSKGIQRKESEEQSLTELNMKLKSRSDLIEQADGAKRVEEEKPEFMKVQLKKKASIGK